MPLIAAPPVQEEEQVQGARMQGQQIQRIRATAVPKMGQVSISRPASPGNGAFFGRGSSAFQPASEGLSIRGRSTAEHAGAKARFLGQPNQFDPRASSPPSADKTSGGGYRLTDEPVKEVRQRAWGRIKKMEAAELAAYLSAIERRMWELDLPPGIIPQIRQKLENFSTSQASDETEIELTQEEGVALDGAILLLESKEQSASFVAAAVAIAGVGILLTVIL